MNRFVPAMTFIHAAFFFVPLALGAFEVVWFRDDSPGSIVQMNFVALAFALLLAQGCHSGYRVIRRRAGVSRMAKQLANGAALASLAAIIGIVLIRSGLPTRLSLLSLGFAAAAGVVPFILNLAFSSASETQESPSGRDQPVEPAAPPPALVLLFGVAAAVLSLAAIWGIVLLLRSQADRPQPTVERMLQGSAEAQSDVHCEVRAKPLGAEDPTQVLQRLVGDWDVVITTENGELKIVERVVQLRREPFVLRRAFAVNPDHQLIDTDAITHLEAIWYSPNQRRYRSFLLSPRTPPTYSEGEWDVAKNRFQWEIKIGPEFRRVATEQQATGGFDRSFTIFEGDREMESWVEQVRRRNAASTPLRGVSQDEPKDLQPYLGDWRVKMGALEEGEATVVWVGSALVDRLGRERTLLVRYYSNDGELRELNLICGKTPHADVPNDLEEGGKRLLQECRHLSFNTTREVFFDLRGVPDLKEQEIFWSYADSGRPAGVDRFSGKKIEMLRWPDADNSKSASTVFELWERR